eukprot:scaffold7092_cov262-Pinguiococcus_pyrenoidosus.AAC.40
MTCRTSSATPTKCCVRTWPVDDGRHLRESAEVVDVVSFHTLNNQHPSSRGRQGEERGNALRQKYQLRPGLLEARHQRFCLAGPSRSGVNKRVSIAGAQCGAACQARKAVCILKTSEHSGAVRDDAKLPGTLEEATGNAIRKMKTPLDNEAVHRHSSPRDVGGHIRDDSMSSPSAQMPKGLGKSLATLGAFGSDADPLQHCLYQRRFDPRREAPFHRRVAEAVHCDSTPIKQSLGRFYVQEAFQEAQLSQHRRTPRRAVAVLPLVIGQNLHRSGEQKNKPPSTIASAFRESAALPKYAPKQRRFDAEALKQRCTGSAQLLLQRPRNQDVATVRPEADADDIGDRGQKQRRSGELCHTIVRDGPDF